MTFSMIMFFGHDPYPNLQVWWFPLGWKMQLTRSTSSHFSNTKIWGRLIGETPFQDTNLGGVSFGRACLIWEALFQHKTLAGVFTSRPNLDPNPTCSAMILEASGLIRPSSCCLLHISHGTCRGSHLHENSRLSRDLGPNYQQRHTQTLT